jgi:hypothetical protein
MRMVVDLEEAKDHPAAAALGSILGEARSIRLNFEGGS